ncbi:GTP cyclohydrolase II [Streptomyces celluloflavus]|uniref:GTP cyclohydrolase-2 n=1 Tax=Streptomyces celluloflavus TaxID=58344 RepID=A0ABW7RPQ1_9ACTN
MAAHHRFTLSVVSTPASACEARHRLLAQVRSWALPLEEETLSGIELVVGELLANAVRHGGPGPAEAVATWTARDLVVEVHDRAAALPALSVPADNAECGRGLLLVDALSDRHGAEPTETGKRCWAAFDLLDGQRNSTTHLPIPDDEEKPVNPSAQPAIPVTQAESVVPRVIDRFAGRWEFLSNYSPAEVHLDQRRYPTVEHAYQAAKTLDTAIRERIAGTVDPDEAKLLGRRYADRADWEESKVAVVRALVEEKFRDPHLRALLLGTGGAELVEGNEWGDEFWGVCAGHGQNTMGLILMAVREQARREAHPEEAKQLSPGGSADVSGSIECAAQASIPTAHGTFTAWGYRSLLEGGEHLALTLGRVRDADRVLVRVHSECLTGEALGSLRCDCGPQLDTAMAEIAAVGTGVILYLRGHEGRGIGLLAKLRAYALQDAGFDTVDANSSMGLPADARDYRVAAQILNDLGVRSVRLLSNNPDKTAALTALGVEVSERVPLLVAPTIHSLGYLRTKRDRMGHDLPDLAESVVATRVERVS